MHSDKNANLYATYRNSFPGDLSKTLVTEIDGTTHSYQDAEERSAQVANTLVEIGLKTGDRVTVQVEKSVEALWLYLGVIRAGMVFHPLNTAYTEDELEYFLGNATPSLVICDPAKEAQFNTLCEKTGVANLYCLDGEGNGSIADLFSEALKDFCTHTNAPNDMAALLYSSGTTGRPKGIMLTHENLVSNANILVEYWGFTANDCLLHALPIFHVHGLFVAIGCVLASGASMLWLNNFNTETVIARLPKCTVMMGVPTYYTRLLASKDFCRNVTDSVRLFISGSAPLLKDTFEKFEQQTGKAILERYGMSETGMNTSNPLNGERKAGTVGFPLPGVELRITDADNKPLKTREVGDIQVKGPNVFAGYWKMPEKTAEDFTEDGFFVTGDQGMLDEKGYVSIVGRSKDMIISGGLNVYPKEIELKIDALPGVVESAVIGLPHADFGEAVTAVIVPTTNETTDAEEVLESLKNDLANFKLPKHIFFVESLPRNTMGKVQKKQLREIYSAKLPS